MTNITSFNESQEMRAPRRMNRYKGADGSQLILVGYLSQIRKGDGALGKPTRCVGIGPVQEVPHVRQKHE
jgi:hypothetical protein